MSAERGGHTAENDALATLARRCRERLGTLPTWAQPTWYRLTVADDHDAEEEDDRCSSCGHREHHGRCSFGGWSCGCGRF